MFLSSISISVHSAFQYSSENGPPIASHQLVSSSLISAESNFRNIGCTQFTIKPCVLPAYPNFLATKVINLDTRIFKTSDWFQINMSNFFTRSNLRAPQNGHTTISTKILKVLSLNSLLQDLIFELCTWIFTEWFYSCGEKRVPVLCLWFFGVFLKISFYILYIKRYSGTSNPRVTRKPDNLLKGIWNIVPNRNRNQWPRGLAVPTYIVINSSNVMPYGTIFIYSTSSTRAHKYLGNNYVYLKWSEWNLFFIQYL